MYRFYFFVSRRVDGRMKLFPLSGQTTFPNHGSTLAAEIPVDVDTEVQMNILDRALACSYGSGTLFGVKMEGNSRRQIRLMAYSDRGRTYYKVAGIVPIILVGTHVATDPDFYRMNRNNELVIPNDEMIEQWQAYIRRVNGVAAPDPEAEPLPGIEPEGAHSDAEFPPVVAGWLDKVRSIGQHLLDEGLMSTANQLKYSISLLLDMFAMGGARFTYRKQNGNVREAVGTLREDIINEVEPGAMEELPDRPGNSSEDGGHVVYFDIEKRAWRSFCTEDFISVAPTRLSKDECVCIANA